MSWESFKELYDYMVDLVKRENIPPARGDGAIKQGGIVLAGWSFGGLWSTAFTAYAHTFSSPDVPLDKYVWRVICYGEYRRSRCRPACADDVTNVHRRSFWVLRIPVSFERLYAPLGHHPLSRGALEALP